MPVVTSETEVCNIALSLIGADEIGSLSESSKEGLLCNRQYGRIRDAMLRAHPWNFATMRVALADADVTPSHEYTYSFTLPADCLRVIRTKLEAEGIEDDYRIETDGTSRYLLSNDSVVYIEYTSQVTNVALWDALFVDCLTARLAAELCIPLTDNATAAENLRAAYADKLAEARTCDAQEGVPRTFAVPNDWITMREAC